MQDRNGNHCLTDNNASTKTPTTSIMNSSKVRAIRRLDPKLKLKACTVLVSPLFSSLLDQVKKDFVDSLMFGQVDLCDAWLHMRLHHFKGDYGGYLRERKEIKTLLLELLEDHESAPHGPAAVLHGNQDGLLSDCLTPNLLAAPALVC